MELSSSNTIQALENHLIALHKKRNEIDLEIKQAEEDLAAVKEEAKRSRQLFGDQH